MRPLSSHLSGQNAAKECKSLLGIVPEQNHKVEQSILGSEQTSPPKLFGFVAFIPSDTFTEVSLTDNHLTSSFWELVTLKPFAFGATNPCLFDCGIQSSISLPNSTSRFIYSYTQRHIPVHAEMYKGHHVNSNEKKSKAGTAGKCTFRSSHVVEDLWGVSLPQSKLSERRCVAHGLKLMRMSWQCAAVFRPMIMC